MALERARRVGESLSSRPARFAEAPPPQPSPAKSGRGSALPSPVQLDLISSCSSYGAIRFNLSNSQGKQGFGKQDFERHDLAVSRRLWRPSCCRKRVPEIKRAQGRPGAGRTHGPPATKKAGGSHHRLSQIIRPSLRDGVTVSCALSPGTFAWLPPSRKCRFAENRKSGFTVKTFLSSA